MPESRRCKQWCMYNMRGGICSQAILVTGDDMGNMWDHEHDTLGLMAGSVAVSLLQERLESIGDVKASSRQLRDVDLVLVLSLLVFLCLYAYNKGGEHILGGHEWSIVFCGQF